MKILKHSLVLLVAATLVAPLSTAAFAGGTISFGINATNAKEDAAIRGGLFAYKLLKNKKGNAIVDQNGNGNSAGIGQNGSGHLGVVHQDGNNHTGTVSQCGNNNAHGLFQFGNGANGNVSQCGNGNAGATFQLGFK